MTLSSEYFFKDLIASWLADDFDKINQKRTLSPQKKNYTKTIISQDPVDLGKLEQKHSQMGGREIYSRTGLKL